MRKRIITGEEVELALMQGNSQFEIDENTIITSIAKEKATKAGLSFFKTQDNNSGNPIQNNSINNNSDHLTKLNTEIETKEEKRSNLPELEKVEIHEEKLSDISRRIDHLNLEIQNALNKKNNELVSNYFEDILDIKIKNGLCVIPGSGTIECDIGIIDGKISVLGQNINTPANEILDAKGKCIFPGIIDPHIHLGIFGDFKTEVETETWAALMGGVTTAGCFFGGIKSHLETFPPLKEMIQQKSNIDIVPHFVIANHTQLSEIPEYIKRFGVKTFKIYMSGIPNMIPEVDDAFILDMFEFLSEVKEECTVFIHAENPRLIARAMEKYKGQLDNPLRVWSRTHPKAGEEEAIRRAAFYAKKTGVKIYFVHISTREAIDAIKELKWNRRMNNIYVETTSPYLTLTTDSSVGIKGKMIPPLRDQEDVDALWDALNSGLIDTIGTDNTTITLSEKNIDKDIWGAVPGYPALATHLPSILHEGINKGKMRLEMLVEVMCKNPAKILGLYPKKGTIIPGGDADLVIVDLNMRKTVKPEKLGSRSDFSLFDGQELIGWPMITIKAGKLTENDRIT